MLRRQAIISIDFLPYSFRIYESTSAAFQYQYTLRSRFFLQCVLCPICINTL